MLTRIHCLMKTLFKKKKSIKKKKKNTKSSRNTHRRYLQANHSWHLATHWTPGPNEQNTSLFSAHLALKQGFCWIKKKYMRQPANICTLLNRCQKNIYKGNTFCIKIRNCWNHWEESQRNIIVFLHKHWYVQQGDQLSLRLDPGSASSPAHWEGDKARDPSWPLQHSENT